MGLRSVEIPTQRAQCRPSPIRREILDQLTGNDKAIEPFAGHIGHRLIRARLTRPILGS